MKKNYFQGNSTHPQHISVGAILLNEKKEICAHYFLAEELKEGYWVEQGIDDFYLLMRETVNPNETLEDALHRGLMEEFGATADIIDYVGSIQSSFPHEGVEVQKTTLYFVCALQDQDFSKREPYIEGRTRLEWREIGFLIQKMKEQSVRFGRTDVDESSILERVRPHLTSAAPVG